MKPYVQLKAEIIVFPDDIFTLGPDLLSGCRLGDVNLELAYDDFFGFYCKSDPDMKQIEIIGLKPREV